ncbi:MAG: hypothetical protein IPJ77_22450 [Planctomycetes bacterium]|nr:hypothetical protein [Planctomycetota bacterium]
MAAERGDIARAYDYARRALDLDPRESTAAWVRRRFGLALARIARERGDLVDARALLAHLDRARHRCGVLALEELMLDDLVDPAAVPHERRQRLAWLARPDGGERETILDTIKRRHAAYRAFAWLSDRLESRRGRWIAWLSTAAAALVLAWGQLHGGLQLLELSAVRSESASSTAVIALQVLAIAWLLGLVVLREHKWVYLGQTLSDYWLVDEARYPGLLSAQERAAGRRSTLYVVAPVVAVALLCTPGPSGPTAFLASIGLVALYPWLGLPPTRARAGFAVATVASMAVFALEVATWDETSVPTARSPWFWAAGAWLLASIPVGFALRSLAARRA